MDYRHKNPRTPKIFISGLGCLGGSGRGGDDDHLLALRERSPYIIFDERQFCQPRLLLTTLQKLRARLLSVTLRKHSILQHNNAHPHTSRKTFYRLKFDDTRRTAPIWHPVASSFFPSWRNDSRDTVTRLMMKFKHLCIPGCWRQPQIAPSTGCNN